ncbi:hypothetical protein AMIS_63210 [Actinoplanes missouriensis 431]|uniref:NnrS family protein n=1 Tax=Actinoplanes missouriensis (strain ATCC 14538 / DSM 43046 / CBS 188.64 / JCM 3121 / NBRC 102363 / NCIMB 12654 / NRRL B-3342 / UNCC 431) TaxID=512565 RepID=I0HEV4_ACTM4|nr:hypothetical protein [Actinoplanes missouriensis]BAL91541.1 hypothetical protein AMIS_63210 [Actinoplanes missouriensis 431]
MGNAASRVPVAWRLPVLLAGGLALIAGLYAGLLLLAVPMPAPVGSLERVHGPVMVFGFAGTLIGLERAVALGARWALLGPACSGAGAIVLIIDGPGPIGYGLMMLAATILLVVYRSLWQRQPGIALLAQVAGAFAWYASTLLLLAGFTVAETVPWLAVFVIATIAGERLELAHVGLRAANAPQLLLAALLVLVAGATATTVSPAAGGHLFGFGLLAVTGWLAVFDVARRTVHATGLPRYIAIGLLAGYAWLALAGLLWAGGGTVLDGPRYDAVLHAVFLGFTMSMIFVHAPVILPAVLRRPLPYHRLLYVPLAVLHVSLLVRIGAGDGLGAEPVWRWAGVVNVAAVVGFAGCAAGLSLTRGRASRRPAPALS